MPNNKRSRLDELIDREDMSGSETAELMELMGVKPASIGRKVRVYRHMAELRQEDLAAKVNSSKQTISRIENDQYLPSAEMVVRMAEVLQGKPEMFLRQLLKDTIKTCGYDLLGGSIKVRKKEKKRRRSA